MKLLRLRIIITPLHLAQDLLGVGLQLRAQLHPGQVRLQQEVGLHVGVVELGVVQFVGNLLRQLEDEQTTSNDSFHKKVMERSGPTVPT